MEISGQLVQLSNQNKTQDGKYSRIQFLVSYNFDRRHSAIWWNRNQLNIDLACSLIFGQPNLLRNQEKPSTNAFRAVGAESVPNHMQMEVIDIQCDSDLKAKFIEVGVSEFYKYLPARFENTRKLAYEIMSMFGSTYRCEQLFSLMKGNKSPIRSRISDVHLGILSTYPFCDIIVAEFLVVRFECLRLTQKLSRWVPHELSERQQEQRLVTCEGLLAKHEKKSFLHRIVTSDEKSIHFSNPMRQKSWGLLGQFPKQKPRPNRLGKMQCFAYGGTRPA
ncbi:CNOT6L [Cordylochernes scorpioides]|uniref:CNOT6L n=1 Tax=Cordylochernes scorpioides TaxID=51811 RepID=A0ABY6LG01_9ARAC|nr:CNOT6L [Cordylochernes scorpioides]